MLAIPCPKCKAAPALYIEEDFLAGKYVKCLYCCWIRYLDTKRERKKIFDTRGRILPGPNREKATVFL